jgi:hypothetical protein
MQLALIDKLTNHGTAFLFTLETCCFQLTLWALGTPSEPHTLQAWAQGLGTAAEAQIDSAGTLT